MNAEPRLGFALELVQADVMARHWRHRGHEVRFRGASVCPHSPVVLSQVGCLGAG
ncbi:class I tRNA ligase family protein [Actinokineospora sp. UTMC 2448]|uniref:class I tRNA ligase family protein n=1 Tax=Actinokineospora sp. UTMC 2448 TaxID=2268449 RepID=UPI0037BFBED4